MSALYETLQVGTILPAIEKPPITTRQLVQYAGASGDFNAIHYDDPFARAAGFPSVIAHGMLSMAWFGQLISDAFGGPATLRRLAARFKAVTFPGDVITVTGEVVDKQIVSGQKTLEVKLVARNQAGALTLEGSATLVLRD
jgi:acyl dehydratase